MNIVVTKVSDAHAAMRCAGRGRRVSSVYASSVISQHSSEQAWLGESMQSTAPSMAGDK